MVKMFIALAALFALANGVEAQSLKGSPSSMRKQFNKAKELDLDRLKNKKEVRRFVDLDLLERLRSNKDLKLKNPSYPYSRPAVKLFVERLSSQYRAACGEALVVTSLTRPLDKQPRNASKRSVHPAGMAADFRVSKRQKCRSWLESTLLSLEKKGVIEATKERRPPHYHVAVFPDKYEAYVAAKAKPKALAKKKR